MTLPSSSDPCAVDGCTGRTLARGWCRKHYKRWSAHGHPEFTATCPRELSRWEKVVWHGWTERVVVPELGACWEFPVRNDQGYGRISEARRSIGAHRVAFEHAHGPLLSGEVARHRCDNPPCVNPAHLERGLPADNVRDMDRRGRRRVLRGEEHGGSRFTRAQVEEMRALSRDGISQERIARLLRVHQSTVQKIVSGRRWKEPHDQI